jgi:hypothetical protein
MYVSAALMFYGNGRRWARWWRLDKEFCISTQVQVRVCVGLMRMDIQVSRELSAAPPPDGMKMKRWVSSCYIVIRWIGRVLQCDPYPDRSVVAEGCGLKGKIDLWVSVGGDRILGSFDTLI